MTENGKAVTVRIERPVETAGFTREQIDLVKKTVAKDATDDELQLFLTQAQRMGLDPFAKQIYFVKRGDKGAMQVGIDGYRLVADRTGNYAGNDDPIYEYAEGSERPKLARVTVWKLVHGQRCPFTATARWSEYVPSEKQDHMWRKMPHVMLAKVAEALALRKAFPAELSGTYVKEEMDQADDEPVRTVKPAESAPSQQPRPTPTPRKPGPVSPLYCSDCREPIKSVDVKGTGVVTSAEIAQKTHDKFRRQLCMDCATKADAMIRRAPAPDPTTGQMDGSEAAAEGGGF